MGFIKTIKYKKLLLASLLIFLLTLPLANSINFYQNDDWAFYVNVESFINGDFTLHPVLAPTFYAQGIIGAIFAALFGVSKLPILTILIAILNFYIVARILIDTLDQSENDSLLLGLLTFLNLIFVYSLWGFMSEHYFLLFILLGFYFINKFLSTKMQKHLFLSNLFVTIGFFVRQIALFMPLSFGIYLIYKKNYKDGVKQLVFFLALFGFYQFIFPKTPEMFEKPLEFKHLLEFKYVYAVVYGIMLYLSAFLLPLFLNLIPTKLKKVSLSKVLIPVFGILLLYFLLNKYFDPHQLAWGEFPYFDNIFERKGFFPRGIGGTKYHFYGIFDLYRYWELMSKILTSVLVYVGISRLIKQLKKTKRIHINYYLFAIVTYLAVLLVAQKIYDRYLLTLFPILLFYLISNFKKLSKLTKCALVAFNLFLLVLSYQFSLEFLQINDYVWEKATFISLTENLSPEQIQVTDAWKKMYPNAGKDYLYDFSYDSPEINEGYKKLYELVEVKEIDYPFNFFINSKIYLHKKLK